MRTPLLRPPDFYGLDSELSSVRVIFDAALKGGTAMSSVPLKEQTEGVYVRYGDSTSTGLAIPEQREHDVRVSQLEWRSSHTTGADLGGVFRIFKIDLEIATSCNQSFE